MYVERREEVEMSLHVFSSRVSNELYRLISPNYSVTKKYVCLETTILSRARE